MPIDGREAATQGSGRDRRDVVDESLRGELRELHRHVAAHRNDMVPLRREDRVEHPVLVGSLKKHLLSGFRMDRPHAVVGASEGDERAVGRPAPAEDGVETDGNRPPKRTVGHIPDLDLAHPGGIAARDEKAAAVGRESHALDPFCETDETHFRLERACRCVPSRGAIEQEHLVEARHGQQAAVGGIIERRDDGLPRVHRWVLRIDPLARARRRVILRALGDPPAHEVDLQGGERGSPLGHLCGSRRIGGDLGEQVALLGLAWNNAGGARVAGSQEAGDLGHDIPAFSLRRLMAALATSLEERPHIAEETDRSGRSLRGIRRIRGRRTRRGHYEQARPATHPAHDSRGRRHPP